MFEEVDIQSGCTGGPVSLKRSSMKVFRCWHTEITFLFLLWPIFFFFTDRVWRQIKSLLHLVKAKQVLEKRQKIRKRLILIWEMLSSLFYHILFQPPLWQLILCTLFGIWPLLCLTKQHIHAHSSILTYENESKLQAIKKRGRGASGEILVHRSRWNSLKSQSQ